MSDSGVEPHESHGPVVAVALGFTPGAASEAITSGHLAGATNGMLAPGVAALVLAAWLAALLGAALAGARAPRCVLAARVAAGPTHRHAPGPLAVGYGPGVAFARLVIEGGACARVGHAH